MTRNIKYTAAKSVHTMGDKKVKAWVYSGKSIYAYTERFELEADRYYMVDVLIDVDKSNTRLYVELRDSDLYMSIKDSWLGIAGDERTNSDVILDYLREELYHQGSYADRNRKMLYGWARP